MAPLMLFMELRDAFSVMKLEMGIVLGLRGDAGGYCGAIGGSGGNISFTSKLGTGDAGCVSVHCRRCSLMWRRCSGVRFKYGLTPCPLSTSSA